MKILLLTIFFFFTFQVSYAQRIDNVLVKQEGGNVLITLNLIPKESSKELYNLEIKSSYDNYTKILRVNDNASTEISPGNGIKMVISGTEISPNFKGELQFSILPILIYSPINLISPGNNHSYLKGKPMNILWEGGIENDNYSLSLYQGTMKIRTIIGETSKNQYTWNVPKNSQNGIFNVKVSSNIHPRQSVISSEFRIKRKFPVLFVIAPLAIIGGVMVLTGSGGSNVDEGIPEPPGLPPFPD